MSLTSRPSVCYEVEKVIGISSDGNYRVQWAPCWVNRYQLIGCDHLIQEFLQQQQTELVNQLKTSSRDVGSGSEDVTDDQETKRVEGVDTQSYSMVEEGECGPIGNCLKMCSIQPLTSNDPMVGVQSQDDTMVDGEYKSDQFHLSLPDPMNTIASSIDPVDSHNETFLVQDVRPEQLMKREEDIEGEEFEAISSFPEEFNDTAVDTNHGEHSDVYSSEEDSSLINNGQSSLTEPDLSAGDDVGSADDIDRDIKVDPRTHLNIQRIENPKNKNANKESSGTANDCYGGNKTRLLLNLAVNIERMDIATMKVGQGSSNHLNTNVFQKYDCPMCAMKFSNKRPLVMHLKSSHKVKSYKCTQCSKHFHQKDNCRVHIETCKRSNSFKLVALPAANGKDSMNHTTEGQSKSRARRRKSYVCPVCRQVFFLKRFLCLHFRKHSRYKPHSCQDCNQSFHDAGQLKEHHGKHRTSSTSAR